MPLEPGWILDWFLQARALIAISNDIKPIAVAPILGHPALIGCQQDRPGRGTNTLHLDEAQLARGEIQACDVVAEILFANIVDLPPQGTLALDDDAHGRSLGLEVRLEPAHVRGL